MKREMRKSGRAIPEEEAIEILINGQYGVLSTVCSDGSAYGCPVNYVYTKGALYFHCAQEGLKLDNITQNPQVSFCVTGRTEVLREKFSSKYESVIVSGRASSVAGEEKNEVLISIVEKYSPENLNDGLKYIDRAGEKTAVIKILPDHISGKARRS